MNFSLLRKTLAPLIGGLSSSGTHDALPSICEEIGLPDPYEGNSKSDRMRKSFEALPDRDLPIVAKNFLRVHPPSPSTRKEIEDILWSDYSGPKIPKKHRRELAKALSIDDLYLDVERFDRLLETLWVIGPADPMVSIFGGTDRSLRAAIDQHIYRNPEDWSVEQFFDKIGALDACDRRFVLFVEGLASADVRPDEEEQRRFARLVNNALKKCGVELRETGTEGGYPMFSLVSLHTASERPKNLIFASSIKPDLRFIDALNNEIEIVTNADKVVVYDRPIGVEGLRWSDLQSWWADTTRAPNGIEAKKSLYRRLRSCLPKNSPPQTVLFDSFYRSFGDAVPYLPALLPEVWLHWDPKTVRERGALALTRFRMDFLLLLPQNVRIVIEVDGKSHYANDQGRADPGRYATMVRADRDLKLAGYEVFHFGSQELETSDSMDNVKRFFDLLFEEYGVRAGLIKNKQK
jgi:hypothetical protein